MIKSSEDVHESGKAHLFSYPFWMYVSPDFPQDKVIEFRMADIIMRIYPPFRSGDANSLPIPSIKIKNIPFAKWFQPDGKPFERESVVLVPAMQAKADGSHDLHLIDKPDDYSLLPLVKPMDSLRLDIFGKIENGKDHEINNRFIELIRYRSKQWWIGQTLKGIVGFNTGIGFKIDKEGKPVGPPEHRVDVSGEFIGDEKPIDFNIWSKVVNDLISDNQPPIAEILMLDAKHHFASRDFRRFVIDAATACEYVKDDTFKKLWTARHSTEFDRNDVLGKWHLANHLDVKLKKHFSISYKEAHPLHWEQVNNLWDARGNVSHGGMCAYGAPPPIMIDRDKAKEMLSSALHCIEWLKSLV